MLILGQNLRGYYTKYVSVYESFLRLLYIPLF